MTSNPNLTRRLVLLALAGACLAAKATSPIVISEAWARATPAGIPVAAGYLTIENRSKQADTLLSVSSPIAAQAGLHRTTEDNGMARMRPSDGVVIPAGGIVKIEPGGLHIMLTGLIRPLVAGTNVPLVLTFRQAGAITVQMPVRATTTAPEPAAHVGHANH
jgi:periplasmic copper chaperone A